MSNDPSGTNKSHASLEAQSLEASLTVADLPRSLAWYRDTLGFTVDREHRRDDKLVAVSLRAGAVRILLAQDDGRQGERIKGAGFSLQFTTTTNVDALADRVRHAGGTFDTEPTDAYGVRVFRLRDPDGFRLVISSPRAG